MEPFITNEDYVGYSDFLLRDDVRLFLNIRNSGDLIDHMEKQSLWDEYLREKESKTVKEI